MADGYSVKINRRDGALEISGDDKGWVNEKLKELADVYELPLPDGSKPTRSKAAEGTTVNVDPPPPPRRRARRGAGSGARASKNQVLDNALTAALQKSLAAYVAARKTAFDKSLQNKAAIIATFLKDEMETEGLDGNDMYTVFSVMGWPVPGNPAAVLVNAKERKSWFRVSGGKYYLTHTGENYGRHGSVTATE